MTPAPHQTRPRRCEGCQPPIPLCRATPARSAAPKCQKILCCNSRNVAQRCALRYVKLKAEGLWPTCSIEGCDREANNGARDALCGPRRSAWRKGQDMAVPIRTPCRVRGECSTEGSERPRRARGWCSHHWRRWHRHGDPLASRCPRYTVDELRRLNAYLGSLAGERTELGDAELLAMSLGRVYGGDLQQTL